MYYEQIQNFFKETVRWHSNKNTIKEAFVEDHRRLKD